MDKVLEELQRRRLKCERKGHKPKLKTRHPIWKHKISSGTRIINGFWKYTYPCSRCGQYLSEDDVDGPYTTSEPFVGPVVYTGRQVRRG